MAKLFLSLSLSLHFLTENENLIFRGNTFATKAVDTYMKMVGETVSKLLTQCNAV